jgi:hypothetical protein
MIIKKAKKQKGAESKKAVADVLRGLLGREPTQDEILGKIDVAKVSPKRKMRKNDA